MTTSYGGAAPGVLGTHYGGPGIGVLGAEVPGDGLSGPGYIFGGLALPADAATIVRGVITRWPTLGVLTPAENSSFSYSGSTDYALYRLYVNGAESAVDVGYGAGIGRLTLTSAGVAGVSGSVLGAADCVVTATGAITAAIGDGVIGAVAGVAACSVLAVGSVEASIGVAIPEVVYGYSDLAGLLQYVHDELPAVPHSVALRALADSAREFCTLSTVWREVTGEQQTIAARADYALLVPDTAEVVGAHMVAVDGKEIAVRAHAQAEQIALLYRGEPRPVAASVVRGVALRLIPAPSAQYAGRTLFAQVSLRPKLNATTVPEFLAQQYARELGAGAKMLLSRQANTPWYSLEASAVFRTDFYGAAARAKRDIESGYMGAQGRVEMRQWV